MIKPQQKHNHANEINDFAAKVITSCKALNKSNVEKAELNKAQELVDTLGQCDQMLYLKDSFIELMYLLGMHKKDKTLLEKAAKEGSYKAHVALNTYFKPSNQLHERIPTYSEFKQQDN